MKIEHITQAIADGLIRIGASYTYKKLTEILKEPYYGGTQKISQLKEWNKFFGYNKMGTKYNITGFTVPSEDIEMIKSKDYPLSPIVLQVLKTYHNPILYTTPSSFFAVAGIADIRELQRICKPLDVSLFDVVEFRKHYEKRITQIFDYHLHRLMDGGLISFRKTYLIHADGKDIPATPNQMLQIENLKQAAISKCGYKNMQGLRTSKDYTSFKKLFNELISGCGWGGVYQVYRIELLLPAEEVVYDEPNVNMIRELLIRDMNRLAQKNFMKNTERNIGNQVYFLSADYKVNQSLIANTFLKPTDKGGTSDAVS